jgi:hypothetical protein
MFAGKSRIERSGFYTKALGPKNRIEAQTRCIYYDRIMDGCCKRTLNVLSTEQQRFSCVFEPETLVHHNYAKYFSLSVPTIRVHIHIYYTENAVASHESFSKRRRRHQAFCPR